MFNCSQCGYKSVKWLGKCPFCRGWQTFKEVNAHEKGGALANKEKAYPLLLKEVGKANICRISTGIDGFDRILGGGIVDGEVILVGGEPGVGKSTLLLEVASRLSQQRKALYVSAEESPSQLALRVKRLEGNFDDLYVLGEDNLNFAIEYIKEHNFQLAVIDSIQAVYSPSCESAKGSIAQIRGCADYLTQIAKSSGIVVFVVGHVTKEGAIAGPKLLEHIVDCVLYFEGEHLSNYRLLRATKNRFGPTGDFALFEMTSVALREVKKAEDVFLPHSQEHISGSSVVSVIEGSRPVLVELQALVSRASFGMVRRRSLGFDFNRFCLLIAIIEKRLKMSLSSEDVFLNAAGGLKIVDPAADLGAAVAIVSSYKEKEISLQNVFIGEVGLAGELRRVNSINLRLKEGGRGSFKRCFIPQGNRKELDKDLGIEIESCASLKEVIDKLLS